MSGDGRIVAFESTEDLAVVGGLDSFRAIRANVNVSPTTFVQLAASRAPAPAISQDGSRIAFASTANPIGTNADGNSEIFLHDTTLRQITNTTPADISSRTTHGNFLPSISDDGRFIAFSSNRNLAGQNSDGNLEIFVFDNSTSTFTQLTSSSGTVGFTDAKISGNAMNVAYIRDTSSSPSANRDVLLQNRTGTPSVRVLVTNAPNLQLTYGRAISDDGLRVVWSAETAANSTQVFLFDGRNNQTRQITTLGSRATDVPLHPTISGDGSQITFATRRTFLDNSDGSVDLYSFDIPSTTFGRVTSGPSNAIAEVLSSMNDDGSLVAFNFPRVLTGVNNVTAANNSEIYVTETPSRPANGTLTILNGASFGHEPATSDAVAPDSIAVARGTALAFSSQQSPQQTNGSFPQSVGGTTVIVNGRPAQIFYVSPSQVNFLVPAQTEFGAAEVVVTNSDGFQSRGNIRTLLTAPGVFTLSGDGLGAGVILNAYTLQEGPFDPSNGTLRLIIFTTGVRNALNVTVSAGGRALKVESIDESQTLPGLDEIRVLVPSDLRGAGTVDLEVRADGRDGNPVTVMFSGDTARDIVINEFLADPPEGSQGDANHDGTRSASQDEFIELFNSTPNDIDIGGYQLVTRGGSGTSDVLRHTFAAGMILRSCTAIVVFGGGNPDPLDPVFGVSQIVTASTGGLSLSNTSGLITLRNASGDIVNFLAFGGSTGLDADENQSLTRAPDITGAFALHSAASDGARSFSPGTQLTGTPFNSCTAAIARVEVSPASGSIEQGQSQQFTARAFDASNNEINGVIFLWESDITAVATIDQNGNAIGVSPGAAHIRATGRGIRSSPSTLTVIQPPSVLTSLVLAPSTATIGAGETQQFIAQAKDQFGQYLAGVTINFASNNTAVATADTVSPTSNGAASASVTARAAGSASITATATNGSKTLTSGPAVLTVEPGAGQLLISEFRTRGPAGAADEFIEIYNPTTSTLPIGGLRIRASNSSGTISDRVTIIAGTNLGPGCHYLMANSAYSGSVVPDQIYNTGLTDDGGIALTGSNGTSVIDAVGMSAGSAFKEATPLTPTSGTANQSYERKPGGSLGNGVDTNNNAADFSLTAPGNPQNSSSPCLNTVAAELSITKTASPNPVTTGSNVTYTIVVTNNGVAVAQTVVVTDDLPESVAFVSCSSTAMGVCGGSGNNRTITFASLAAGASETITLVATTNAAAGTMITNTAAVTSNISDPNPANNSSTVTTTVQARAPDLSIDSVAIKEGDAGIRTLSFTVSLSSAAVGAGVTFDIATQDHTATSSSVDYVAKNLTGQNIPAGKSTYTFDVVVNGDTLVEPDESFLVNVSNVTGATVSDAQGEGTIHNDDTALLVISQLYGGGGNSGAQFTHDFIELFNRGTTTVDLSDWSVQYLGATGTSTWSTTSLSGLLRPGQYYLVQENSAGANGAALPTPDTIGSITMAATAGKIALVSNKTPLSGSCPSGASIADMVGYGNTATCFEGSGPAPAASATSADFRKAGGCIDTNNNAADFFVLDPFPRNTAVPFNNCTSEVRPDLTINDVAIAEGNGGATVATFTVSLSTPVQGADVTFDIATTDGSAQDNNPLSSEDGDYLAKSLTNQIIPAGQQTFTFTVTINADTAIEADETFFVNVTNVSGATLSDGQGLGTIQNDDIPTLSINDVSLAEGDSGTKVFTFTVNLSADAPAPVTFDIATADGTAQDDNPAASEDNDYVGRSGMAQVIPEGQSTYTFDVTVNGDMDIEPNETFVVNVSNVSGAVVADGQGIGTIQNDDTPSLSLTDVTASETDAGITTFTFTVASTLPAPAGGITFDIATADGTAHDDNPVSEDNDYLAKNLKSQTIPFGQTQYTFNVTVNGDVLVEADETFFVNISNVTNATVSDSPGLGKIQNDDTALVVISQLYGAGGNAGATLRNDFIEIFNRGTSTVDLAGWSVQYTSATGTTWQVTSLCPTGACLLLPGKYFLVQEAGGANGELLPAADATGSIAMAATAGKVALVSNTTALTASGCPIGPTVLDFVAYGTTPSCFEGTGSAPPPSATNADVRKGGGCVDSHNNVLDFFLHTPTPRNNSFPANTCNGQKVDLSINDVTVTETDVGTLAATFTVTLHGTTDSVVIVDYSTADDTAITPDDYDAITTTQLLFNPGETTKTITVGVRGDKLDEPNETFFVNLANASNAAILDNQGRGTITDNDVPPALTINDVALNENNAGTTVFAFTVHLSAPALTGGVSFDIATADGSAQDDNPATEDFDYVAQSLTSQTIPAGSQDFVFNVTVNGDLDIEPNETFFVNITNVTGATVSDAQGQGTIQNDDSPTLTIDDVTANEGNSGTTILTFTVTSSLPAPAGGITFDIATADGTAQDDDPATEDNDYLAQSLTGQTIPEGLTTYTFPVTVTGDTKNEAACETFFVNVTNAINATIVDGQGQGAITDEDGTKLVISQIYGGGGNAGATYTNDFIEIFNRGNTAISLNGMSVQYSAATSSTGSFAVTALPNVMLQPGQYFLVRQAGGATGIALPTPDATGSINMAAGAGKVALVNSTTALTVVGCPSGPTIIDFVGYGTTANCREGASTTDNAPGVGNNTTSVQRDLSGCQDSNNNQLDFATAPVAPRNTASAINICSCIASYSSMLISPFHQTNLIEWSLAFGVRGVR